jgi:hypothetical protein
VRPGRATHARSRTDGAFLAGVSDAGLALYPVEGGEARPIKGAAPGDDPLRFSGDGRARVASPS